MALMTGFRFTASLGKTPKETRTLLLEVTEQGELKCSHTGGDVWSVAAGGGSRDAAAAAAAPPLAQKCNAWDQKGRNPAMNVYVHLDSGCSSSGGSSASGGSATSCSSGDEPVRCKLGVLVQHALPQLAARLGGYSKLHLDWVTWGPAGASGAPADASSAAPARPFPASVKPLGRAQNEEHWQQLQELARQKETGAGTTSGPSPDATEELALRRAKETLVATAQYFGVEAVARVSRLTVRKLYSREYHFYDGDQDIADSRRHALEWAVGLAAVNRMLACNPEAKAKLSERLTGPTAGGGSSAAAGVASTVSGMTGSKRKRVRPAGASGSSGGGSRRVMVLVPTGGSPRGGSIAGGAAAAAGAGGPVLDAVVPPRRVASSAAVPLLPNMGPPGTLFQAGMPPLPLPLLQHLQQLPAGSSQLAPAPAPRPPQAVDAGAAGAPAAAAAAAPAHSCGVSALLQQLAGTGPTLSFNTCLLQQALGEAPAGGGQGASSEVTQAQPVQGSLQLPVQGDGGAEVQQPLPAAPPQGACCGLPRQQAQHGLYSPNGQQHQQQLFGTPQLQQPLAQPPGQQAQQGSPTPQHLDPLLLHLEPPLLAPPNSNSWLSPRSQRHAAAPRPQLQLQPTPLPSQQHQRAPQPQHHPHPQAPQQGGVSSLGGRPGPQPGAPARPPQPPDAFDPVIDAALEAWEQRDRALRQLEQQRRELAAVQQQRDALQRQLAQAQQQLAEAQQQQQQQEAAGAGAGTTGGSLAAAAAEMVQGHGHGPPSPATPPGHAAAAAAQLEELRAVLPQGLQYQLLLLLQQRHTELPPQLLPHAATICQLSCRAMEQVLGAYATTAARRGATMEAAAQVPVSKP